MRAEARNNVDVVDGANVFVDWLGYAAALHRPAAIDLQAANNEVKHGLAVRARSDVRLTLVARPPNADGSVPLSAFTADDAIDIFDQAILESLGRPKVDGHRQGLELTQLRLRPSAILADAFMLARTHGAMFHFRLPRLPGRCPRPENIDARGAPRDTVPAH